MDPKSVAVTVRFSFHRYPHPFFRSVHTPAELSAHPLTVTDRRIEVCMGATARLPRNLKSVLSTGKAAGFSLLELLVVMTIIVIMAALLIPAFTSINKGQELTRATGLISSMVQEARAYAMANNTYVYLGIGEFDASQPDTGTQKPASAAKGGRVAVAVAATRDGTRGYSPYTSNVASEWTANYKDGTSEGNLTGLSKVEHVDNLHIIDFSSAPPTSGTMARPNVTDDFCRLGSEASSTATPFAMPLGALGTGYTFNRVIQFDPQGVARVLPNSASGNFKPNGVPSYIEIAFQPSNREIIPEAPSSQTEGNHSVVQIDGLTGSVNVYRP